MEDIDKLIPIVQRMSPTQLKELIRFAQFLLLEDEPDDLRDQTDPRARYGTFKELLDSWNVDPGAVDAWAKQTGNVIDTRADQK
jgi:hypothetical protein